MPNTTKTDSNNDNNLDKDTMLKAGVDISSENNVSPEDVGETIVDIDSGMPKEAIDGDIKKTGIKFFDDNNSLNKEDLSSLAEAKLKEANSVGASDLEAEFKSELSSAVPSKEETKEVIGAKVGTMKSLLAKIRAKLGLKKTKVKTELEDLKKMKEGISKDISDIKELEESEHKIEEGLKKVEVIKSEMEEIEKEVNDELKD